MRRRLVEPWFRQTVAVAAAAMLLLVFQTAGYAMTTDELVSGLEKAGADETPLLKSNPVTIEETRPDFLAGASYLRVTVRGRRHPHLLQYVAAPNGTIYRLKLGAAELERMRGDLKLDLKSPDMALHYVQWLLDVTEGPAFWLVSSLKDVPFQPVAAGEDELAKEIDEAKKKIAPLIEPPKATAQSDGFSVTQEAVRGSDLVRYDVKVSRQGACEVKTKTLAPELPVVYVLEE
jgi:hypothetical protein